MRPSMVVVFYLHNSFINYNITVAACQLFCAYVNNGTYEFLNAFYETGRTDIGAGNVEVKVDESSLKEVRDLGLHTYGLLAASLYAFDVPTNQIARTIYNNWDEIGDQYNADLFAQAKAAGLLAETATVFNFEDTNSSGAMQYLAEGVTETQYQDFADAFDAKFVADFVDAEHTATNMAVAGGAFTAALDYNDQVTAALDRRTSLANVNAPRTQGFTPWVDVFGTTNEAKRLYGNGQGYETDIYGAVLGFDYTAACGGVFGVAFNVGTGDGNSVGTGHQVDNDADYYGFSAYGAYSTGLFNFKADLGYTQASNDLSTSSAYFGSVKESLDADIFTVGVGTEVLVKAGSVNVVPHAGIRMNRLSMDDSKYGADYDDMTVYQLPLGVSVSAAFDVNGWKLAPAFDVSVVPTFGDKDAVASYFGGITETTRVVDTNPVQGTLGVEAQNGAFTFGLNYRLTAGGDDRQNNSFNANVRYSF